jgi:hypothetical protein
MKRSQFTKSDLTKANFANSTLDRVIFAEASMVNTNFEGAKLSQVSFVNADMQNSRFNADTKLDRVDFSGANLSRAKMDKVQANGVMYDSRTNFPAGFAPGKYGFINRDGGGGGSQKKKKTSYEDEDEAPPVVQPKKKQKVDEPAPEPPAAKKKPRVRSTKK